MATSSLFRLPSPFENEGCVVGAKGSFFPLSQRVSLSIFSIELRNRKFRKFRPFECHITISNGTLVDDWKKL